MEQKTYYLDHANTTFLSADVYKKMLECYAKYQANPTAPYVLGRQAKEELELAREKVAKAIGANANEIYFTSSATEANNWAIKSIARANKHKGKHIITSQIEHESVLESCKELEREGFKVTYVPVDENGVVDYASIIKSIGPDTILISIMMANHEVGSLQPIRAIAELAMQNEVYFHTDAAQAIGALAINVAELGVDALSISSHKIGGPKGVGALYIKEGTKIDKFMAGDDEEQNMRAGNISVAACAGFGVAIEDATTDLEEKVKEIRIVRKHFQKKISEAIHNIALNGHPTQRLANNCSISFEGANAEAVVMLLDKCGIYASMGSSAEMSSNEPNHVLFAMGKDIEAVRSTVRFTFGPEITKEDIDDIVETIRKCVKKVRSVSAIRIYKNKVEL